MELTVNARQLIRRIAGAKCNRWPISVVPGDSLPTLSGKPAASTKVGRRWKTLRRSTMKITVGQETLAYILECVHGIMPIDVLSDYLEERGGKRL